MDGQVTWSDLGFSFGRTLSEHSAATKEKTSQPCWKKLRVSQNQDFLYLDCRKSGNGQKQEQLTVMGGLSLGELTTLRTGKKPSETAVQEMLSVWGPHSVAEESRLSQILEVNPLHKYNLTAKACLGILRRAERRGKDLPERLKAVLIRQSQGASPQERTAEKSGTLGMARDSVLCAGFKLGNSEQARSIGYQEELSPTLNAECGENKPAVVAPVVALDMTHACDVIRECGEQAPSLQARMGTGGNQVPLTYQMNGFGDYRATEVASSCKQRDFKDSTDLVCDVDCRNFREGGEINGTLQAKESGQSLNLNNTVRQNMVLRHLTPMECERLQGFPDHWTDIGEWTDEKGKKHKDADSPRYKALGNSIALPFWDWMLRRMARYLPEDATLGSLFDGIGGFPLIWERIHGKGTARWASEIEPFPIAVTKKHFPEEE